MASVQVVETSVANNNPSQDSSHPDDLFQSQRIRTTYHGFNFLLRLHFIFFFGLFFVRAKAQNAIFSLLLVKYPNTTKREAAFHLINYVKK